MPVNIAENIARVRQTIAAACQRAGRSPDTVALIAVSKTQPVASVLEALQGGISHLGENRVEEAALKVPSVAAADIPRPTWHMIGHIQSRKARDIPSLFDVVHSVDSLKVATLLGDASTRLNRPLSVLVQINMSGEASKEGLLAVDWQHNRAVREALWTTIGAIQRIEGIDIQGLMTLAPFYDDAEQTRPVFQALAGLRDALRDDLGLSLTELSMGMTNDYEVAIEEGATQVRIGRAVFGERN